MEKNGTTKLIAWLLVIIAGIMVWFVADMAIQRQEAKDAARAERYAKQLRTQSEEVMRQVHVRQIIEGR